MKNIIFLFSIISIYSFGQTKNKNFNQFLKDEQVKNAQVSFTVLLNDAANVADKGGTQGAIINYNTNKLMYPASLQKLITTKIALDILGPGFKYKTKVK